MLSLVLPTYNEAKNLPELLPKLEKVLKGIPHEIIIVDDDSPDKTWEMAQDLSQDLEDVHVIRRIGRRGLSSAVIEGWCAAKGEVLAVMDADGQHDTELLPKLYDSVLKKKAGIAIGSRFVEGASVGKFDERRQLLSRTAIWLAIKICKVKVADPMTGFFAIEREVFEKALPNLNPKGFKILLDVLVHIPKNVKVVELPFTFGKRLHGESKLSTRVKLEFLEYLYDVTLGKYIPLTFVKYCIVGSLGVGVHITAYSFFVWLTAQGLPPTISNFSWAVAGATETAIIFNFLLNNVWTFRNARLRGGEAMVGFLKFNGACIFGALANIAVSAFLYSSGWPALASVAVGAFTGVLWNYTMNKVFTWRV